MFFTISAIVIVALCIAASGRRLAFAAEASGLDAKVLLAAVRQGVPWLAIADAIGEEPAAAWERDLIEALRSRQAALVNEQLGELDYEAQRWARVPRVCASIATSAGFLLASLAVREGLEAEHADVNGAIASALNAATVGIAGAAFCIAAHVRAGAMVKERLAVTDKLIERLEAASPPSAG